MSTDSRGNCIEKNIPGGGWTYMAYDKGGRCVFTQDAVQREQGRWAFRLVDILGGECVTGKELATETGLYDFSARYLETSNGRFTTIDPLAEKYPSVSPYAYCAGDPVNRVDPDGRKIYDADGSVITYDLKNGWSSNADPKFVEIASLMQKYHTGSAIINSMVSSQVKYTVTFIDTLFPENRHKMGENKVIYIKDERRSIFYCQL